MAESAVATPPVPKPRTSRPTRTPPIQDQTHRVDSVSEGSPEPPPYSSLLSPSPTPHTDSDDRLSDSQQVVLRKKVTPTKTTPIQLDEVDDDYENIDAALDEESRENVRRSDYINWVYMDSDGEEVQSSQGGVGHDRSAPSIKLDRHPALKKSQSNSEIDAASAAADFIEGLRQRRPRNRAPPPPPGKRSKDKGQSPAPPSPIVNKRLKGKGQSPGLPPTGHKRSQSDLHLAGYAQENRLQRPHPPPGGQSSRVVSNRTSGIITQRSVPSVQRSPDNTRRADSSQVKGRASDGNIRPKRHAPPPPASRRGGTPDCTTVNKLRNRTGDQTPPQSDPLSRRSTASSSDSPPPKPFRARRVQSIEDLSQTSPSMRKEQPLPRCVSATSTTSSIMEAMDVFTLELRKKPEAGFGLVIVSGRVHSGGGGSTLEGIFIQKVVPNSAADNDGRIQPGDMLLEVGGRGIVGRALDDTIDLLKEASESIRLKVARPDAQTSVLTVEGGEEQPLYENEVLSSSEILLKLRQSEEHALELEAEKDRALNELLALRKETEREKSELKHQLEEMTRQMEATKKESEVRTGELTQALASVTVGKTKVENEVDTLRSEVKVLREQMGVASDKEGELVQVKAENVSLQVTLTELQDKLDSAESAKTSAVEETVKLRRMLESQDKQISSLKSELEQLRNTRTTPIRVANLTSDPTPLDQTYVKDIFDDVNDESTDSDNAFEDNVPSLVTPSPYLDFVPLEAKGTKEQKKGSVEAKGTKEQKKDSVEAKGTKEQHMDLVEAKGTKEQQKDSVEVKGTKEQKKDSMVTRRKDDDGGDDETSPSDKVKENGEHETSIQPEAPIEEDVSTEFDALTLHTAPLNSSAALHKTQISRKLARNKPSRQHLKNMGSSSDLLEGFPPQEEIPPQEGSAANAVNTEKQGSPSRDVEVPSDEILNEQNIGQTGFTVSQETITNGDIVNVNNTPNTDVVSPAVHDTPPQPKPRPRPRVRQTPSMDEKRPQVAPRHKEPVETTPISGRGSPLPAHKPPVPRPVEQHNSPLPKKKEPILPSPKPSPKHTPKTLPTPPSKNLKPTNENGEPPKPHPRHSLEYTPQEDSVGEVIVKQRSAPESPVKVHIPPPPVAKKPKHGEEHASNSDHFSHRRSKSLENELEVSPLPRRKLPAGAVNIMGFLPVASQLKQHDSEGDLRERSCTVSTTEPRAREGNTLKRQIERQESSPINAHPEDTPPVQDEVPSIIESKKIPPKRPPPPAKKPPNGDQVDGISSDDFDSDASPMVATKMDHSEGVSASGVGGSEDVDCTRVLSWSVENVGMWVESIGLGRFRNVFVERGVLGHVLFDVDGHTLKGMGMDSHNDRSVFKREVKALKPFADKQKKVLEKMKKEEKKNAKKIKKK